MTPSPLRRALASLVALLLLCGCAGGGADAQAREPLVVAGGLGSDDAAAVRALGAAFEARTGTPVTYDNSNDLLGELVGRDKPDVAILGDPGMFRTAVARGLVAELDGDVVDEDSLLPSLEDVGVYQDGRYGVPLQVGLASLVWYPRAAFEAAGYEVPETYAELVDLTEEIRGDGVNPWCAGVESAQETGWVLTDWVEQLVLDGAGPQAYDRWVAGELAFASPEVTQAARRVEQLLLGEADVYGGARNMLETPVPDAITPMIKLDPPGCYLLRQSSFLAGSLPPDVELGTDLDVFAFPPVDPARGPAALVSVDLATLVQPSPEGEAFLEFLGGRATGETWLQASPQDDFLSPHRGFDPARYPSDLARHAAEALADAEVVRLDASLQMPYRVGQVAFHTEMIDWVVGRTDLDAALAAIDEARRAPRF